MATIIGKHPPITTNNGHVVDVGHYHNCYKGVIYTLELCSRMGTNMSPKTRYNNILPSHINCARDRSRVAHHLMTGKKCIGHFQAIVHHFAPDMDAMKGKLTLNLCQLRSHGGQPSLLVAQANYCTQRIAMAVAGGCYGHDVFQCYAHVKIVFILIHQYL